MREGSTKTGGATPGSLSRNEGLLSEVDEGSTGSRRTRHTLQPEYVAPQTHTARAPQPAATAPQTSRPRDEEATKVVPSTQTITSKPLPQDPPVETLRERAPATSAAQKMQPPVRPARDIPRSVSDSASAFGAPPAGTQGVQYAARPSTQGSITSSGPANTRSDLRLPSRGSYGQPVAPTVAATNVQGRVTQPTKPTRGYNISGPLPQSGAQNTIGQPMTTPMPPQSLHETQKMAHHRRSSTLSGLGERLFGRSNSVAKRDLDRQKTGRKYPPTSMKEFSSDGQPRMSTDSKRSLSFGLGKKRSTDLESQVVPSEKPARRFSLIPSSMSFRGLMGGSKDDVSSKPGTPQTDRYPQQGSSRPATGQDYMSQQISNSDGQYDGSRQAPYNNFSRPPQAQSQPAYQSPGAVSNQAADDVYGSTGVYSPQGQYTHQRQQSEPLAQMMTQHPEAVESIGRPSMQQGRHGRGVLVKNNRKFAEAYEYERGPTHHSGRSGAVKKVQDFFRRRRAPTDVEYR